MIVLAQKWTQHELVGHIEDLDDLVKDRECLVVVHLGHVSLTDLTKDGIDLLHDLEDGLSFLVKFKLKLLAKAEESLATCQDALIVS